MADVKINLEASQKEFAAAMAEATKVTKQLVADLKSLDKAQKDQAATAKHAAEETKKLTAAQKALNTTVAGSQHLWRGANSTLAGTVALYLGLYEALKFVGRVFGSTIKAAVTNIDDFNRGTIGTAAAITNIAEKSEMAGVTWNQVFHQNLKATRATFIELERLAARYFASSTDLQLAYNAFAQRGVVIRRTELEQLAQLTDLILLLTQGQQSSIQVQEEIRSLINGTIRPTAQLAQLIKSFGLDVKDVAREIRTTQSLKPLEGILRGAREATTEIQKTYQATFNGLETLLRQIGRIAGEGFFTSLTGSIQKFTAFLDRNKEKIGSVAAVFGRVLGDVIERAEKFAETLLNGESITRSIGPLIELVAVVETLGSVLFRVVEIAAIMLRNLPAAFAAFRDELDLLNMPKAERDLQKVANEARRAAEELGKIANDESLLPETRAIATRKQLEFGKLADQAEAGLEELRSKNPILQFFDDAKKSVQEFIGGAIPGLKDMDGLFGAVGAAAEALLKDVEKLGDIDFAKTTKENIKSLTAAIQKAEDKIRALNKESNDVVFPNRVPFKRDPQDEAEFQRTLKAIKAAEVRADRARRTANEAEVAQGIDTALQAARRRFALLEQGFEFGTKALTRFNSVQQQTLQFTSENIDKITKGGELNLAKLASNVGSVMAGIQARMFANLQLQLQITKDGVEEFIKVAKKAQAVLIADDVTPLRQEAETQTQAAHADFAKTIDSLAAAVEEAKQKLAEATIAGIKGNQIAVLERGLKEAQNSQVTGAITAAEVRDAQLQEASAKELLATEKEGLINAQTKLRVNTELQKIKQEELRIEQAIQQVQGDIAKSNLRTQEQVTGLEKAAAAGQPRTELQAELGQVNEARISLETNLGATIDQIRQFDVVISQMEPGVARDELQAFNDEQRNMVERLREAGEAANNTAESNARLRITWDALGAAADRLTTGLSDALLKSFEGVKTDMNRLLKDITDNLFKDSLKNVFQTLKTELSTGLGKAITGLGKSLGLDEKMAESLGPAFVAGFALIASFVLGQLLGNQGGSSTAGNPTVGIQSTEQVRGLIGGETQIPIGQIGESLQDALVPTNLWLARIYGAITAGGISAAQVESIIERSVNEALQIQPA